MKPKIAALAGPVILLMGVSLFCAAAAGDTDRIPVDATIHGQPVRLIIDTGSAHPVLFRKAVERLGLKITTMDPGGRPVSKGDAPLEIVDCDVAFGQHVKPCTFGVLDTPAYLPLDADGVIPWVSMTNLVVQLDYDRNVFGEVSELPSDFKHWSKWRLVPNTPVVLFESTQGPDTARIGIDTGAFEGVMLSPARWVKWRSERAGQPFSLDAAWSPVKGLEVFDVLRARKFTLGGITLEDIPVQRYSLPTGNPFEREHADALLGVFAIKQLRVIIDARKGLVYTAPIRHSSARYGYNRLGAVFVPNDPNTSEDLVAHVARGGPSERAGVRDGDVLLRVGNRDVTKWRTEPGILPLSRFWSQAAGAKVALTLQRGGKPFEATVVLEDLPSVD